MPPREAKNLGTGQMRVALKIEPIGALGDVHCLLSELPEVGP